VRLGDFDRSGGRAGSVGRAAAGRHPAPSR
jgi:hypothetical protein